jgi:hypothetical protein
VRMAEYVLEDVLPEAVPELSADRQSAPDVKEVSV